VAVLGRATEPSEPVVAGSLRIVVLGGFGITRDGAGLPLPKGIAGQLVKAAAVFGSQSVDEMAELLWPGAPPGAGRTRIRNVLSRLRATVGEVVVRSGEVLRLAPGTVVDREVFERRSERALAAAATGSPDAVHLARSAMALHGGELLPGDRPMAWTAPPRDRLERRFDALLDLLVDHAVAAAQSQEAVRLIEIGIGRDPYDERRYAQAARLFMGSGQRSAAVTMLRRARDAARELGVAPSAEVEELERACRWNAPLGQIGRRDREMGRAAYER
jgi:DNA-binding SARP family transcriptional activator